MIFDEKRERRIRNRSELRQKLNIHSGFQAYFFDMACAIEGDENGIDGQISHD